MRLVLELLMASTIAVVIGIGSAFYAVEHGHLVDSVWIGDWVASPNAGTPEADPYSAAAFAKTGEVAIGSGEGIAFVAERDNGGQALTADCDYIISGSTPPARLWTLSVIGSNWQSAAHPDGRRGIHSKDVLRDENGEFTITLSKTAKYGNWLPIRAEGQMRAMFRLYDTPITSGSSLIELSMPKVSRGACQ